MFNLLVSCHDPPYLAVTLMLCSDLPSTPGPVLLGGAYPVPGGGKRNGKMFCPRGNCAKLARNPVRCSDLRSCDGDFGRPHTAGMCCDVMNALAGPLTYATKALNAILATRNHCRKHEAVATRMSPNMTGQAARGLPRRQDTKRKRLRERSCSPVEHLSRNECTANLARSRSTLSPTSSTRRSLHIYIYIAGRLRTAPARRV